MTRAAGWFRLVSSHTIGDVKMIAERNPQSEPERETAAPAEPQPIVLPPKKGRRNFNPVKIGGKPLSETVIEERRNARY